MDDVSAAGHDAFAQGEGDRWFRRNLAHIPLLADTDALEDRLLEVAQSFGAGSTAGLLVEVGCARGDRLSRLARRLQLDAVGIDLSDEAITEGRSFFGDALSLRVAPAHSTGLPAASVAVLFFAFVLTYGNSTYLARVVAETLRLVQPSGLVAVYDWDYGSYLETHYHHLLGLSTFRHDYRQIFEMAGFSLVDKASLVIDEASQRTSLGLAPTKREQLALWVFRRELDSEDAAVLRHVNQDKF